jgi:8-oxo-dGTP pyrophosphatase MutT (NUDIX family)
VEHFVVCSRGCTHWGAHGAAGLLLRGPLDRFLLVQRGLRTHQGGTWSVPGGAALQGEDPFAAALREAVEELGTLPLVTPVREHRDDHGGWAYVTVIAEVSEEFEPRDLGWETADFRWVTAGEATDLDLHPGLRDAWPRLMLGEADSDSEVA